jgi:hypothetical protein
LTAIGVALSILQPHAKCNHSATGEIMIGRIWHGWTTPGNADPYEALLRSTIFPGIVGRKVPGFRRIELLRRPLGARKLLSRFDATSQHYEVREVRTV